MKKYRYWDLTRELATTDFKLKYQGSIAGYLWSLAKPLMIFGVLYMVFNVFVRIGSQIPHYPLYLLLGVLLWMYFAETTSIAMRSIVDKSDMIRKVYFPRIVLLLASTISSFITLLLNLLIVFLFMAIARVVPSPQGILFFFLLVIELYILALGVSFFLSALFVKYRDIGHIWEVLMQVLFYATPIIYPLSIVPIRFQKLIILSPITQIIQDSRSVLVSSQTTTPHDLLHFPFILIPYLLPIFITIFGYKIFVNSARKFAEEV